MDRAGRAQDGVTELEQRIRPRGQRVVELLPEPGEIAPPSRSVAEHHRPGHGTAPRLKIKLRSLDLGRARKPAVALHAGGAAPGESGPPHPGEGDPALVSPGG